MSQLKDYKDIVHPGRVFTAIDVETTGLDSFYHKIVEIACVRYSDGKAVDSYSSLVNPGRDIPEEAFKISGISNEMVADQPPFSEIHEKFLDFIQDAVLVAHNVQFDLGFINSALAACGHSYLTNDYIDTLDMARRAWPGRRSYALQVLARDFSVEVNAAHRAADDARVCMEIFYLANRVFNPGGQISLF
jgi:DNA polymerase III subunit epsilon